MVTLEEVETCVSRGANYLDMHEPDWFNRINLDKIDLDSASWCILAQIYGSYSIGRNKYFTDEEAREGATKIYGFLLPFSHSPETSKEYYEVSEMYREAWSEAVNRRIIFSIPVGTGVGF